MEANARLKLSRSVGKEEQTTPVSFILPPSLGDEIHARSTLIGFRNRSLVLSLLPFTAYAYLLLPFHVG